MDVKKQFSLYFRFLEKYKFNVFWVLFFAVLVQCFNIGQQYIYKYFIDYSEQFLNDGISTNFYLQAVFILFGVYIGSIILIHGLSFVKLHIQNKTILSMIQQMKTYCYNHIIHLSYDFHTTNKSGTIITRIGRAERAFQNISEAIFDSTLTLVLQVVLVLVAVSTMHWLFTIIILLSIIAILSVNLYLQKLQLPKKIAANKAEDKESGLVSDTFTNMETITLFGKQKRMQSEYYTASVKTQDTKLAWEQYFRHFNSFSHTLPSLTLLAVLGVSVYLFLQDAITLGDLVFVQATFLNLLGPVRYFTWMVRQLYTGLYDLESINKYLDKEQTVKDKTKKKLFVQKGEISFEDVSFSYHKKRIFNSFSLNIKPGERVALVGVSGSGKSTFVKLLYRLYDIQKGQIRIDDTPIDMVTQESLRESLSIVPQEGVLFDNTLYHNLQFSNPKATKKDIEAVIKHAQLTDLIKRLPNGLQTVVGERGIRLSGGERQRVAIARALLTNKKILVLDEATSALDSHTEHSIQKALKTLLKNKTAIIIAHRLSTIMHADKIIVLDNGKIIESGTHTELLKKKGKYATLWQLQKDGYIA